MLQQRDRDLSNFLPGYTPGLGAPTVFYKILVCHSTQTHITHCLKNMCNDCISVFLNIIALFPPSPGMLRTWLRTWTILWWRWSKLSFGWTNWRPWRHWQGWERRNATYRTSGADSWWGDKGILQHPLGFSTPSKKRKSACSAVTSRTIKLWMLEDWR